MFENKFIGMYPEYSKNIISNTNNHQNKF